MTAGDEPAVHPPATGAPGPAPAAVAGRPPPPPAIAGTPARAFDHLGRRLLVPLGLGLLTLVGLALFADVRRLATRLAEFDPLLLVPVLALSLVNYGLRFARWQLYLKTLGVPLPAARSLGVHLVGFLLSVTPGKAGELGKAWLVRELGGGPARRAVPAVVAERLTDLLCVGVLVGLGALGFPGGWWLAAAAAAAAALAVALVSWRRGAAWVFAGLGRLRWVGPRVPELARMLDRLRSLLSPSLLAAGLGLATVAWGAEAVGFWLVVGAYDPEAGFLVAMFDYNAATFLGGLTLLPGGLVAAEGAMAALLDAHGLDPAAAASATLITRAATLWFAVALGLAALPWVMRAVGRRPEEPPVLPGESPAPVAGEADGRRR